MYNVHKKNKTRFGDVHLFRELQGRLAPQPQEGDPDALGAGGGGLLLGGTAGLLQMFPGNILRDADSI